VQCVQIVPVSFVLATLELVEVSVEIRHFLLKTSWSGAG
jgi:hypothetical protein